MHGLVFVTWEKYLAERFGVALLQRYREMIGETSATGPLASQVYSDQQLLAGVSTACQLTGQPSTIILREYGRYFILNGLTSHLCSYLLTHVHNSKELLLTMRDAHAQIRRSSEALTPPLFRYEASPYTDGITIIYDSSRQLCELLHGAIEGAAIRFGETVTISESACMKRGAKACRFDIRFQSKHVTRPLETPEQIARQQEKQRLGQQILRLLPEQGGIDLGEIQQRLFRLYPNQKQPRLSAIQEAINHLLFIGLAASINSQPGENIWHRRYKRIPTEQEESNPGEY